MCNCKDCIALKHSIQLEKIERRLNALETDTRLDELERKTEIMNKALKVLSQWMDNQQDISDIDDKRIIKLETRINNSIDRLYTDHQKLLKATEQTFKFSDLRQKDLNNRLTKLEKQHET